MKQVTREDALEYHCRGGRPGKLSVTPTKPMTTQKDLSLAYTPGVAVPVLAIAEKPELAYKYTARANLVGVVTNGTAILGLGDRGPLASKPVMEGKAVLFKKFADIDVFDIELDCRDPEEMVRTIRALVPTFGGINLEDIKAPECFYIEQALQDCDIPVFHDDQHGTAIIVAAALINGLELQGKRIEDVRLVVSGAGAAAISCMNLVLKLGARRENLILVDSKGVIYKGRTQGMTPFKEAFAAETEARTLADALRGADVFFGLSVANTVTPEMAKSMAPKPLILALANPDPEIPYDVARAARPDAIVGTGRSDCPNQINNVLGFPFIFRGALDVQARCINDEMKIAAARSLAALAREEVPDSVLVAYGLESLRFGPEYLIPKPLDPRVLLWEAPAVAQAAMDTGVARNPLDLDEYRTQLAMRQGKGERLFAYLMNKARSASPPQRIVFAEGEESRILRAAAQIVHDGLGVPILIGRPEVIHQRLQELGIETPLEVVDPENNEKAQAYAQAYHEMRCRKGVTAELAVRQVKDPNVLAPMMVKMGDADTCIAGLLHDYPEVLRPALQIHHTRSGVRKVSGAHIVVAGSQVYVFTDAHVNIDPDAMDLAESAILAADLAAQIGLKPRVAMLSFSNFGSAQHARSRKMAQAVELVRERRPDIPVDGEMHADAAVVPRVLEQGFPFSRIRGANVLVFPSLEAAHISSKLLATMGNAVTIGPILLGAGAPVHVLQSSSDVTNIVHMAAVAVMDALSRKNDQSPV
jgi:malate dehydrogenase (oxaloacetate-decarboxylating)(NADP+)